MFAREDARAPIGPGRFYVGPVLVALLLAQAAMALALAAEHRRALIDDAFISFRYADRWAHGHGWTWNDGSRVEGFSNPLWTYLLGVLDRGAHIPPHRAALPLGILAGLGATLLVWGALGRRKASLGLRGLAAGALALDVGLGVWAGSGLETSFTACCVALLLFLAARTPSRWRDGLWFGCAAAALALLRPEGVLWSLLAGIWLYWGAWAPVNVMAGFALGWSPAVLVFLHRRAATGSFLSNTFFAKLEPSMLGLGAGVSELGGWLVAHAAWILLVGMACLWQLKKPKLVAGTDRWWLLLLGCVLAEVMFLLAAGGDWMGRTRFLVPMLPAVYLLGAEALRVHPARLPVWCIVLVLIAHGALGWRLRDRIPSYTQEGETLGRWLARSAAQGDTVATTASGAIPYFSGLPAIDVLGLNDPSVRYRPPRHRGAWAPGHHRYDIERLLENAPEWIVWDFGVSVNRHRMLAIRDEPPADASRLDYRRELFAHGKFTALYEVDTSAPPETQRVYTVFHRKE